MVSKLSLELYIEKLSKGAGRNIFQEEENIKRRHLGYKSVTSLVTLQEHTLAFQRPSGEAK